MKNLKKILSYAMMIIMGVFLFLGVNLKIVLADEELEFKTNNGIIFYEIDDNNKVTITQYSGEDTKLEIPSEIDEKSVTTIGKHVFSDCDSLTSINVEKNNKYFSSQDGILFNKDKSKLLCYPCGKKEELYIIPDSVINIESDAFRKCLWY